MRVRFSFTVLVFAALAWAGPTLAQDSLEYPVKAAFLVRFGDYVEWPAAAFASPTAPLQLCIVGDDPFGPILEKVAAGQPSRGRSVEVKRLRAPRADSGCHIAFIARSESARMAQVLDGLRGAPVLTVTDQKSPPVGIINFTIKEERVRFDIDDEAAMQSGLAISSKLLALALNVRATRGAR